ncbi:MAG: hypothetical protein N4A41_03700 [Crocinitomicaceae bacterium]|jgi:hypothetical protein|nr:hypothetical protein [Crocinitomicaceae bacterium]
MKLKITLYLSFAFLLIFSCAQDESAFANHINQIDLLQNKLVNHTWKHTEKLDDKFTQKAEIRFFPNGEFVKKDSYNYIGIEEHFEEGGKWSIDSNGKRISIKWNKSNKEESFRIVKNQSQSLELVSEQEDESYS